MKVSELSGASLDYWVAKADAISPNIEIIEGECGIECDDWSGIWKRKDSWLRYNPSNNWHEAGPIIEREKINLNYRIHVDKDEWSAWVWSVNDEDRLMFYQKGPTPLIAAMRCYVASKFGDDVVSEN